MAIVLASGCGHPSDAKLLANFARHRAELDELVIMFEADRALGRVGANFTRPEDPSVAGVASERIDAYRRLCRAIGAPDCIEGYGPEYHRLYGGPHLRVEAPKDPIWIHVSSVGLSISGSSKGYYYSRRPTATVADLDRVSSVRSHTWFRHIEGPWYLYFDYED